MCTCGGIQPIELPEKLNNNDDSLLDSFLKDKGLVDRKTSLNIDSTSFGVK